MTPKEQRIAAIRLAARVSEFTHGLIRNGRCADVTDALKLATCHLSYAAGNTRGDYRTRRLEDAAACFTAAREYIEGNNHAADVA